MKQKQGNSTATHFYLMHCDPNVGAGLPAMQTPRSIRYNQSMPSQASQLPPLIEFSLQDQVGCQAASLALLI
ncbi:hypothetical protein C7U57_23605 [Pseudomonas sp. R9.37]|nr:hypothetical protein C7U57_23605 [Pseudomonas sp. R9.37]